MALSFPVFRSGSSPKSSLRSRQRRNKDLHGKRRQLLLEPLEMRWLLTGVDPTVDALALAGTGPAVVPAGTASADSPVTSYEYVAPTSYAYAGPNGVNLKSPSLAADLPAAPPEEIVAPPALPEHVSASIVGGSEVGGSEVVFLGDAGHANHVVFSVDAQGRLQHNLGGRFGLAGDLDLDAAAPGVQSLTIGQLTRLTYRDLDAVADDAVTIGAVTGAAGGLDLGGGRLAISAGTVTIHGPVHAAQVELQAQLLDNSGAVSSSGSVGGRIAIVADQVLNSGLFAADGTAGAGGEISLTLAQRLMQAASGVISASGQGGSGGRVTILAGDGAGADGTVIGGLFLSGTIRADGSGAGAVGGQITIAGGQLDLYGATVQANGAAGGGRVHVGESLRDSQPVSERPDHVDHATTNITINPSTLLSADAVQTGSGGQVVVWSAGRTTVAGRLTARGGAAGGDGGAVEASGLAGLVWQGQVDVTAPAGRAGSVLFDPKNITVLDAFNEFVDPHPAAGNGFGSTIVPLSTGNVVITSPGDDAGASNAGAVYLFNGSTGALISTLRGSNANDAVGTTSVAALSNGNYVVVSSNWYTYKGAVTWGSGTTGVSGTVSSSNSLVGTTGTTSTNGDKVGSTGVVALSNGNYVVRSGVWGTRKGAVTWGSGTTGVSGTVSATNSLVGSVSGSSTNDQVGSGGVTALSNGNYVVSSPLWDNGSTANAGAVTWGSGATGVSGTVSSGNSLVGSTASDSVGGGGVVALSNGNYVVRSPNWSSYTGAATWGSGTTGVSGTVSSTNSLVGSIGGGMVTGDQVGSNAVTALSNGNYVVCSPNWNSYKGAVTLGSGTTGVSGTVTTSNSLVGSTGGTSATGDRVGTSGVVALSNGNYVVLSPFWGNSGLTPATYRGAVTWGSGTEGVTGSVSSSNSLVGATASATVDDRVGSGGVTALSNGNYVVRSPNWDNGSGKDANLGAVTWGSGTAGVSGAVSSTNSLVGSTTGDQIGSSDVTALSNGNYVVCSPNWNSFKGAATWGSGTTGVSGTVSDTNSLIGSTGGTSATGDQVGFNGAKALSNGNYVVVSTTWSTYRGAVTWGSGTAGITGAVSSSNSLVGVTSGDVNTGDQVGRSGVVALSNGNYVVTSQDYQNSAGAVTWGSGTMGASGVLTSSNSLVGSSGDMVGMAAVTALSNGNYVVKTYRWDNGALGNAGAVTWGNRSTGVTGTISSSNSLVGLTSSTGLATVVADDVNGTFLAGFVSEGGTTPLGGTYGGRVRVGSQSSGVLSSQAFADQAFAAQADQSLLLTPAVDSTLNTGAAVTLQVNNDLTVKSPITANNPSGNGGDLTLQAGRSLLLNANITTDNGNLTLTGNDSVAHGVVDADRDSGDAVLTMAAGTNLNVGTGTLTVALRDSTDKTYNARGVATLQDVTAAATVLNDGTILANGIWTSPVTVNSGATLGGTGTVGALTVAANGTVAPGNSRGLLNSADVALHSGSNFNVELNGTTVGTLYDQLNVTGNVTIDGGNLNVTLGYTTTIGDSFVIIANDGTDSVTPTSPLKVAGAPILEGGSFTVSGQRFVLTYAGGTNSNDVVLTREDASSFTTELKLDVSGNLVVSDISSGGQDDTLTVQSDTNHNRFVVSDPNYLLGIAGTIAGAVVSSDQHTVTVPFGSVSGNRQVNTLGGDDSLTIDSSLGNFTNAITFDGGAQKASGNDVLVLTGGTFGTGDVHSTAVGAGTLQYAASSSVGLITWSGLESLTDDNAVTVDYTLYGTDAADAVTVAKDTGFRTKVSETSNNFVPVSFKSKTNVTVNGMDGDDALTLGDNSTPATGLSQLTVDGSGGADTLTISGDLTLPAGTLDLTAATLLQTAGAVSVALLNLTGAVTQSGGTLTVGRDTLIDAGTGNVSLTRTGNDFGTVDAFGNNVTIVDTNDIELGWWIIDGNLDVTAGGEITVSDSQEVAGTARFVTKKDGGADILVNETSSTFGSVTIQSLNAAGTAADGGMIVLGSSGALDLASVQTSGTADVWAGGPITDSGTLSIGGAASFETDCDSGAAITLDDPSSTFGNLMVLARDAAGSTPANGEISITENADLTVTQIQTGAAAITLITSGDVTIPTPDSVSGSGTLTIKPLATTGTVGGGAGATGTLNLDATDLAGLAYGFSSITIGRADFTSGSTDVNTSTFRDPVTIYGYALSVGGLNAGTNAVTLGSQGSITAHAAASSDITGGAVALNAAGAIGSSTTSLVINASVGLTTNSNVDSANGAQYLQPNGSGTVNLTNLNAGTGTIQLTSSSGGTFQLSGSGVIDDSSVVRVDAAKFDLNGKTETVGGVTLVQGEIQDSAAVKGRLTSGTAFAVQQGTVSGDLAGAVGLTKSGSGTVMLSGRNVYTGTTTVSVGTLALSSGSANNLVSSALLDIQSGATLDVTCLTSAELVLASGQTLHGTGTVVGKLNAPSGATVGPGSVSGTSTGTLLQQGNFALATGSTLEIHIGGGTAGLYDNLSVQGGVNLGGATLSLLVVNGYDVKDSDEFQILTNDGEDAVTGTFAGLAEGSVVTLGTVDFQISYVGGTGNDITLKKAGALIITSVTNTGPVVEHTPVGVTITAAARPGAIDALTYDWDFDNDGAYEASSSTDTAVHTYLAGGQYPVGVRIRDTKGGIGTSSTTVTVLADLVPPTSHVGLLAGRQTSPTFAVTVTGSDPAPASGVATFAIYVAVDNGPLSLYTTLTADASGQASFDYTGQDSHLYWFRSVARDQAGNTESKPAGGEVSTYVPDLITPVTQVTSVDTTQSQFQINWSGMDSGGSGLATVQIWGQVDSGTWTQLGQYPAGTPTGGTYSGTMTYAAIVDGQMHSYSFYSVGKDGAQNAECAPSSPDVGPQNVQFTPPDAWSVSKLTLNKNNQLQQRSYLRYADVTLNRSLGVGDSVSLNLRWLGLDGAFNGPEVSLPITGNTVGSSLVSVDFGAPGITKYASGPSGPKPLDAALAKSSWGDGYYALDVSVVNGSDTFTQTLHFYRLLGELTGDGKVDTTDYNEVLAVRNSATSVKRATAPTILNADANGSGVIDAADSNLVAGSRTKNAAVAASPPWQLDALVLRGGTAGPGEDAPPLVEEDLPRLVAAALGRWQAAGLADAGLKTLQQQVVQIKDLPSPTLGLYGGGVLYLDHTADGQGWFLDPTPDQDEEFPMRGSEGQGIAAPGGLAAGQVDLLTVLAHEFGHALGLEHRAPGELMGASLGLRERKVATVEDVGQAGCFGTAARPALAPSPASPTEAGPLPTAIMGNDLGASRKAADGWFAALGQSLLESKARPRGTRWWSFGGRPRAAAVDHVFDDGE